MRKVYFILGRVVQSSLSYNRGLFCIWVTMLKAALSCMNQIFSSVSLMRGQDYQARGNVLSVRISEGLLRGRVKGSSNQIYDVYLDLKNWPQQPSRCTCSERINCKHAAACLCAYDGNNLMVATESAQNNPGILFHQSNQEEILTSDDVEWYSDIEESQHLFFTYQLGILIDGQQVSIVPLVADLIIRLKVMQF